MKAGRYAIIIIMTVLLAVLGTLCIAHGSFVIMKGDECENDRSSIKK